MRGNRFFAVALCCAAIAACPALQAAPYDPAFVLGDAGADQSYSEVPGRPLVPNPSIDLQNIRVLTGNEAPDKDMCEQRATCALIDFELHTSRRSGYNVDIELTWPEGPDVDLDLYVYVYEPALGKWMTYTVAGGGTTREQVRMPDLPAGNHKLGVANNARSEARSFRLEGSITYVRS